MPVDDDELMSIRADTLFVADSRGRIVQSNEIDGEPAPRLFVGRTQGGYMMRVGTAVPDATAQRLADILEEKPPDDALTIPPAVLALVREELSRDAPLTNEGGGPAYCFPDSLTSRADVVEITPANSEALRETFPGVHRYLESSLPCMAVLDAGAAVSVCFSARNGPRAAEAGVETLAKHRGRGYGAVVTAAWGARIRAEGRIPIYSTWWGNASSQVVARRHGLRMFGTDATWD